jgi:peptide/nickel transport system permease protein
VHEHDPAGIGITGPITVATTLSVGGIILTETILSFLGLGIPPRMASWGAMPTTRIHLVGADAGGVAGNWPSVICCNLLGDGLRDALDPRA